MAEHISGTVTGDQLAPLFAKKSKSVDEKRVSAGSKDALAQKIDGELADGWQVAKRNKKSVRMARPKPIDRQLA